MREVACVGNRRISIDAGRDYMVSIGRVLAERGAIVSSGNAYGSDLAFATGASRVDPSLVNLYVPSLDYNSKNVHEGNSVIVLHPEKHAYAFKIVKDIHPAYEALTPFALKLMARNVLILKEASLCFAWQATPGRGGTDFVERYCEAHSIRFVNIATPEGQIFVTTRLGIQFPGEESF